jgi:hypothetical protein
MKHCTRAKRPTTVLLAPETRARLELARERHTLGHQRPSLSVLASLAIDLGLDSILGDESVSEPRRTG